VITSSVSGAQGSIPTPVYDLDGTLTQGE